MSIPKFTDSALTREEAINQVISSIAMEKLSLSHIINAEGEKLQYILGTMAGITGPGATIAEVLEVSISCVAQREYSPWMVLLGAALPQRFIFAMAVSQERKLS